MTPVTALTQRDTHRLINSKYSPDEASVLTRIANDDAHLSAIFQLDDATNDRLRAMADRLPGIAASELVQGPLSSVVNAAFCHAGPTGARFNGPDRGAWYAGFAQDTSVAEITFHRNVALAETDWFHDDVTYDDYLADFAADFHDIREGHADCLLPDDHRPAQALAERLLAEGSNGVIYPSVRDPGGTCLACFRPALVGNVRKGQRLQFCWDGAPKPTVTAI